MAPRLVFLAIVCLVALGATSPPKAQAAMTCGQVVNSLTPCMSYVMYGNTLSPPCCDGVKNLNSMAQTTPDRRTVCNCLKSVVNSSGVAVSAAGLSRAAGLPGKCGVNIPYQISPKTDCNRVN